MIASVVVTLDDHAEDRQAAIDEISRMDCVEVGDISPGRHRLPVMIDSPDPNMLEATTRRLQDCRGVAFVDVVFVHFENESPGAAMTDCGKPAHS
jgi:nitrate reductase NapAB chaperone NapD